MAKCKKCVEGIPHEFTHGSSSYSRHGCRCEICKAATAVRTKTYREQNRERLRTAFKQYAEQNREHRLAYFKQYAEQNREHRLAYFKQYRKDNPEYRRAHHSNRRQKLVARLATTDRRDSVEWRKAIKGDPCFYCGGVGEHDDHFVPLAKGGTDHWYNLVRACALCNLSKSDKMPTEFTTAPHVADHMAQWEKLTEERELGG